MNAQMRNAVRLSVSSVVVSATVLMTPVAVNAAWRSAGDIASADVQGLVALADGRALVVHGATSEVYDPASNAWGQSAALNGAHENGDFAYPVGEISLTLLHDGRVLLVGTGLCSTMEQAELYDPATNRWTATSAPHYPRYNHGAALLHDGRLLIAGGMLSTVSPYSCEATPLANSEIFDPATETWTLSVSSLANVGWNGFSTQTLMDGSVVMVGTSQYPVPSAAQRYWPQTDTWQYTAPMIPNDPYIWNFHTVLLPDGKMVATGDCYGGGSGKYSCSSAQVYDATNDTWTALPALLMSRSNYALTANESGQLLVTGGELFSTTVGAVYIEKNSKSTQALTIGASQWSQAANLPAARSGHFAVQLSNGEILIVGGNGKTGLAGATKPLTSTVVGTP